MTAVVDSSVLIDHLREREPALALFRAAALRQEPLIVSAVSRTEILAGMRAGEEPAVRALFDTLIWVPVDDDVAELAGGLANRYRREYPGISIPDYLIASTALHLDADLWTLNVRDFPMFPDLRPPY